MWRTLDGTQAPLFEDDPESKLWIAKSATYSFLNSDPEAHFGFAAFPNTDGIHIGRKINVPGVGRYVLPRDARSPHRYCAGWEGNGDSGEDTYVDGQHDSFNIKYETEVMSNGVRIGDVVPFDWDEDNAETIRQRLAPNLSQGGVEPDFGVAPYFEDFATDGRSFLQRLEEGAGPYIAVGLTPLAYVHHDFRDWYANWAPTAAVRDPEFDCRQKVLLLMTDGFEVCSDDDEAVDSAAEMFAESGIRTYVIAFAVDNPVLDDVAAEGGTEAAYQANSEAELLAAYEAILADLQTR